MKRITAMLLTAIIFTLSVFSLNAFALTATESDATPETELLAAKWYREHGNEFSADVIGYASGNVYKGKAWFKDGNNEVMVNEMNGIQTRG